MRVCRWLSQAQATAASRSVQPGPSTPPQSVCLAISCHDRGTGVTGRYPSVGVAGGMAALWHAQATPGVSPSETCTPGHPWPYSIPACTACLAPATGARRHTPLCRGLRWRGDVVKLTSCAPKKFIGTVRESACSGAGNPNLDALHSRRTCERSSVAWLGTTRRGAKSVSPTSCC
jgi:hypothetical protein